MAPFFHTYPFTAPAVRLFTKTLEQAQNNIIVGTTETTIAENIPFPIDTILAEVSALIEEDKIIEDLNGKLRINR